MESPREEVSTNDLTSTMDSVLSTSDEPNKKSPAVDLLPTSSSDANKVDPSSSEKSPEDPISSTSDVLNCSTVKSSSEKPEMKTYTKSELDEVDIFANEFNLSQIPREKITENVEDIVSDLETLLGKPSDLLMPVSKKSLVKDAEVLVGNILKEPDVKLSLVNVDKSVLELPNILDTNESKKDTNDTVENKGSIIFEKDSSLMHKINIEEDINQESSLNAGNKIIETKIDASSAIASEIIIVPILETMTDTSGAANLELKESNQGKDITDEKNLEPICVNEIETKADNKVIENIKDKNEVMETSSDNINKEKTIMGIDPENETNQDSCEAVTSNKEEAFSEPILDNKINQDTSEAVSLNKEVDFVEPVLEIEINQGRSEAVSSNKEVDFVEPVLEVEINQGTYVAVNLNKGVVFIDPVLDKGITTLAANLEKECEIKTSINEIETRTESIENKVDEIIDEVDLSKPDLHIEINQEASTPATAIKPEKGGDIRIEEKEDPVESSKERENMNVVDTSSGDLTKEVAFVEQDLNNEANTPEVGNLISEKMNQECKIKEIEAPVCVNEVETTSDIILENVNETKDKIIDTVISDKEETVTNPVLDNKINQVVQTPIVPSLEIEEKLQIKDVEKEVPMCQDKIETSSCEIDTSSCQIDVKDKVKEIINEETTDMAVDLDNKSNQEFVTLRVETEETNEVCDIKIEEKELPVCVNEVETTSKSIDNNIECENIKDISVDTNKEEISLSKADIDNETNQEINTPMLDSSKFNVLEKSEAVCEKKIEKLPLINTDLKNEDIQESTKTEIASISDSSSFNNEVSSALDHETLSTDIKNDDIQESIKTKILPILDNSGLNNEVSSALDQEILSTDTKNDDILESTKPEIVPISDNSAFNNEVSSALDQEMLSTEIKNDDIQESAKNEVLPNSDKNEVSSALDEKMLSTNQETSNNVENIEIDTNIITEKYIAPKVEEEHPNESYTDTKPEVLKGNSSELISTSMEPQKDNLIHDLTEQTQSISQKSKESKMECAILKESEIIDTPYENIKPEEKLSLSKEEIPVTNIDEIKNENLIDENIITPVECNLIKQNDPNIGNDLNQTEEKIVNNELNASVSHTSPILEKNTTTVINTDLTEQEIDSNSENIVLKNKGIEETCNLKEEAIKSINEQKVDNSSEVIEAMDMSKDDLSTNTQLVQDSLDQNMMIDPENAETKGENQRKNILQKDESKICEEPIQPEVVEKAKAENKNIVDKDQTNIKDINIPENVNIPIQHEVVEKVITENKKSVDEVETNLKDINIPIQPEVVERVITEENKSADENQTNIKDINIPENINISIQPEVVQKVITEDKKMVEDITIPENIDTENIEVGKESKESVDIDRKYKENIGTINNATIIEDDKQTEIFENVEITKTPEDLTIDEEPNNKETGISITEDIKDDELMSTETTVKSNLDVDNTINNDFIDNQNIIINQENDQIDEEDELVKAAFEATLNSSQPENIHVIAESPSIDEEVKEDISDELALIQAAQDSQKRETDEKALIATVVNKPSTSEKIEPIPNIEPDSNVVIQETDEMALIKAAQDSQMREVQETSASSPKLTPSKGEKSVDSTKKHKLITESSAQGSQMKEVQNISASSPKLKGEIQDGATKKRKFANESTSLLKAAHEIREVQEIRVSSPKLTHNKGELHDSATKKRKYVNESSGLMKVAQDLQLREVQEVRVNSPKLTQNRGEAHDIDIKKHKLLSESSEGLKKPLNIVIESLQSPTVSIKEAQSTTNDEVENKDMTSEVKPEYSSKISQSRELKLTITKNKNEEESSSILKICDLQSTHTKQVMSPASGNEKEEIPIPKLIIKQSQCSPKLLSPLKITIKPLIKPEDQQKGSPKLIIKPIIKPDEDIKTEEKHHSPKITIKHIPKPLEEGERSHSPKITIKPIIKPPELINNTKLKIKPIIKPDDMKDDPEPDEEMKERIVLKINKVNISQKEAKKVDENEKLATIKVKLSKEGGCAHIVNKGDDKSLKRSTEITNLEVEAKKQKLEQDDVIIIEDYDTPVVVPEIAPVVLTPIITPKRRGRPRKVPLEIREDFKETPLVTGEEIPETSTGMEITTTSGRPKRSCRGPSVKTTLGIKPRKPRGSSLRGRPPGRSTRVRGGKVEKLPKKERIKESKLKLLKEAALTARVSESLENQDIDMKIVETIIIEDSLNDTLKSVKEEIKIEKFGSEENLIKSDVVMYEEETRMSAETNSRAQTPAKQVLAPTHDIEESQSSTATSESIKVQRRHRLEFEQEPGGSIISADQLAEYYWANGGPYMLQEQVAQFLGIKSFKRKYPGIQRRPVDMQERDFIRESGLVTENMCDLGLTAVNSSDILDIMYTDFQHKYEEYCKHQRDRLTKDITNKQKALSLAASQEKTKFDIMQQAVESAANWNSTFNRTRKDQRKACMDLQTMTINFPKGRCKQINKPKLGSYPIALVPGQYTDYHKTFTPTELNNLPFNTMLYEPIKINVNNDEESQSDGSGSDSDTSSSDSDSSDSESSEDDCKICNTTTPLPKKAVV